MITQIIMKIVLLNLFFLFTASLGYSVYSTEPWDGLSVLDPFHTAKSVVSFVVEDSNNLKFDVS
jgi:hypothetical protein